jgi:hypothetical protein
MALIIAKTEKRRTWRESLNRHQVWTADLQATIPETREEGLD